MLQLKDLHISFDIKGQKRELINGLELELYPGENLVLLGRNGVGKSSLLKAISGKMESCLDAVFWEGRSIKDFGQNELARKIAWIPTTRVDIPYLKAFDYAALGRLPYLPFHGRLNEADKSLVHEAFEKLHIEGLKTRGLSQLSDGEFQKVQIARALCQDTPLILLDEPSAFLDYPSKVDLFSMLNRIAKQENKMIIYSTHDLDLAWRFAEKTLLLAGDGSFNFNLSEQLILDGHFNRYFDDQFIRFNDLDGHFEFDFVKGEKQLNLSGDQRMVFWTEQALAKGGIERSDQAKYKVECNAEGYWKIEENQFDNLKKLIQFLNTFPF